CDSHSRDWPSRHRFLGEARSPRSFRLYHAPSQCEKNRHRWQLFPTEGRKARSPSGKRFPLRSPSECALIAGQGKPEAASLSHCSASMPQPGLPRLAWQAESPRAYLTVAYLRAEKHGSMEDQLLALARVLRGGGVQADFLFSAWPIWSLQDDFRARGA